ncbi:MAG: ornithine carbamoyltransferase, partial [Lentisphaerae bacterium]|nr:ornithine carbamoyltransferase [Lentisphaerota bacterium]
FVDCTPVALSPDRLFVARARALARRNGGSVTVTHDPRGGVRGANVLYTDVWASMGEEALFRRRLRLLRPYQVNMAMIRRTGNMGEVIFLHCLPAYHNHDTDVTRKTGALEVADDVFEAPFSKVFDQAENRMHTIKALIVATMTGKGD